MLEAILWTFLGFVLMEVFSWAIHKYLMHGILWNIHKTHHTHTKGFFELNDLFTVIFGGTAIVLILLGAETFDYRFWIGCGISLYGMSYFILHDVLIHKRLSWFNRPKSKYLKAITEAHKAHHSTQKNNSVSFGLFVVPREFWKKQGIKE
ncbi:sterol desaturase family protein [Roseivirga spongicola]|uniref:sterol desaturase family protein n=1 Tax=Roseivirga spongicola TaxID=333140 RepID=UPI000D7AE1F1|nr:sterol desaturase family protein [Roseivirga spongicola]PWL30017.1 MAG: fatty acid hydroxylase [Roseivirga sp. XM-24bin3]WPZ11289.1 sterol desaturase family protein [Roseivirga spongicola]